MLKFLFILSIFSITNVSAQNDTSRSYVPATWKKLHAGIRLAAGLQKNFYTEFGLTLQRYIYEARHGFMAYTFYTSYEWVPPSRGKEEVNGVKIGTEMVNNGGTGGIEVKYLFNSKAEDVVITPKFGFGMGFITLFYGYNVSTKKYPFPNVRKHQFSLAINSNIFHHDLKNRKR